MRRALGYKLDRQGRQLLQFVAYLDEAGASTVTIEHAIALGDPAGRRRLATTGATGCRSCGSSPGHLQTIDPACEVPPKRLLPYRAPTADPVPLHAGRRSSALMRAAR